MTSSALSTRCCRCARPEDEAKGSPAKGTGRRGFLKTVALAGGAAAEGLPAQSQPITRTFSGRRLARIAFPLGGVGASSRKVFGKANCTSPCQRSGSLVCRDLALSKLGTGASQSSATIGKTKLQPQVRRGRR